MRYEFHPEAEQEFIAAATRYEGAVLGLGLRFANEVNHVIELLLDSPEMGAPIDDVLRHFVLRRFPFSVVYATHSDVLFVVAVAHSSREPGYWQDRAQPLLKD